MSPRETRVLDAVDGAVMYLERSEERISIADDVHPVGSQYGGFKLDEKCNLQ